MFFILIFASSVTSFSSCSHPSDHRNHGRLALELFFHGLINKLGELWSPLCNRDFPWISQGGKKNHFTIVQGRKSLEFITILPHSRDRNSCTPCRLPKVLGQSAWSHIWNCLPRWRPLPGGHVASDPSLLPVGPWSSCAQTLGRSQSSPVISSVD